MKNSAKKDTEWVVGTDDVGQTTLKWNPDSTAQEGTSDPFERTYDFLRRLDVDGLSLERESTPPRTSDPYNSKGFKGRRARIEAVATKEATAIKAPDKR